MNPILKSMDKLRALVFLCLAVFLTGCGAGVSPFTKTVELNTPPVGEPAYVYVPFDVPAGARSVSVLLEYDKDNGKNRLELGVFDERFGGKHDDKNGFRGWSGSVRDGFFISGSEATHGYQKGEITPGTWYVVLGLASLESEPLKATLSFSFDQVPPILKQKFDEERAREFKHTKQTPVDANQWLRGDLHAHTFHGDGSWSVKGILDSAVANNLDFVALTEHNTFSHHSEIDNLSKDYPGLLILKSQEITTYGGHLNAWGVNAGDWVDFRVIPESPASAIKMAVEAHAMGALISANHPTMECKGCEWTYGDLAQMDSVEVWNATWDDQDEAALRMWDRLLQQGKRITAIGSSDTHQPPYEPSDYPTNLAVGSPTVFVKGGRADQQSLFENIKAGKVYVAEDPSKHIVFSAFRGPGPGDTANPDFDGEIKYFVRLAGFENGSNIRVIYKLGNLRVGTMTKELRGSEVEFEKTLKAIAPGYMRLEVRNPDGSMAAFTNPIWIRTEGN